MMTASKVADDIVGLSGKTPFLTLGMNSSRLVVNNVGFRPLMLCPKIPGRSLVLLVIDSTVISEPISPQGRR